MADREKVIQALRRCIYDPDPGQTKKELISCSECTYYHGCTHDLMRDAIELLEVKDVEIKTNAYQWKFYHCPTCGKDFYGFDKRVRFCNQCGQGIRWPEKEDGDA